MRDTISAELNVWILHYHVAQRVSERVVFVVKLEGGGVFGGAGELYTLEQLHRQPHILSFIL